MASSGGAESCSLGLKSNKKERTGEEMDRISDLPDAVIHHIFSFISTVDAVRTSMLAKRWRYIWTQMTNLHFDDCEAPFTDGNNAFVHLANSVITQYNAPRLESCSITIEQLSNAFIVDDLVRFAIRRNVNELSVDLNADMTAYEPMEMPCCGSVRDLSLQLGGRGLMLPVNGTFSSLESLSFSRVRLVDDTIIYSISKQCPRLKSLSFSCCSGLQHLDISCPLLEDLEIEKCEGLDQLIVSAEKLQSLSVHDSFTYGSASVKILAPNLQSLNWLDYIVGEIDLGKFRSLKAARVSVVVSPYIEDRGSYLINARKFFRNIASAQSLAVEIACFWGLSINMELFEGLSAQLHNLKYMKLLVGLNNDAFRGISYLFKNCPNLEALEIQNIDRATRKRLKASYPFAAVLDEGSASWRYQNQSLDHLQQTSFCGFRGKNHEIEFVEFLLRNSVALSKMLVHFSDECSLDGNGKASVTQRLMEFKPASPSVVIRAFEHLADDLED